ncbi:MAG: hypothetical protein M1814_003380 [Vezdaea aestivalis]|nr:MAG: hypothetical protein M1814_003380 [Vezdaea aestivalis]
MAPSVLLPRIHFLEIDDKPWFPSFLRTRVQSVLTTMWTFHLPILQPSSPTHLAHRVLLTLFPPPLLQEHVFLDFCSGAGGPVPALERLVNDETDRDERVRFVLSDIHPHTEAWRAEERESRGGLGWIERSVDASDEAGALDEERRAGRKVFRTFFLAFHHFDDQMAKSVLKDAGKRGDGFLIFELVDRDFASFITNLLLWPLLLIITPFYYWQDPVHLFFTYIIPILPFVLVFDGIISSLRCRGKEEIRALMGPEMSDWKLKTGSITHTWPTGNMIYFIGSKN